MINNFTGSTNWPPHAFRFGGGGKSSGQQSNPAAVPIAPATAPATASSAEVVQAQQDMRRQALKKKGFASTYHAGDTGGWHPQGQGSPSPGSPKYGGMGEVNLGNRSLGG